MKSRNVVLITLAMVLTLVAVPAAAKQPGPATANVDTFTGMPEYFSTLTLHVNG